MEVKIIFWILISIVSAILYRMGGSGVWNTKWRDIGSMLCATLCLLVTQKLVFNVATVFAVVAFSGLTFASLTTYFKKKGTDTKWFNWVFVGLAWGISALPIALVYHCWLGLTLRTMFLGLTVCLWSQFNGNVVWEENGRGALLTASIPLLLI